MRILHIIPKLRSGGTEKQLVYLCNELVLAGHEVHIAFLHDNDNNNLINKSVYLHKLRSSSNHSPALIFQLIKIIKGISPDIVNTWILQMDVLGGIASLFCGVPFVLREPSSSLAYSKTWKNRLRILVGRFSSAIISNSNGGIDYWEKQIPNHLFYKIFNGIPIQEIIEAPVALIDGIIDSDKPVLLYVGRLVADVSGDKNLISLLEALAVVNSKTPVNCILCGDGPQRLELEKLSNDLNISDKVFFVNHLSSYEVWGLMKKSSVFISLSSYEGCPNSVLEAIVCKLPLVLSDIPAHRELLDSSEVKFVDHSDVSSIADGVFDVVNDLSKWQNQAVKNTSKMEKFSTKSMVHSFESVYFRHKRN